MSARRPQRVRRLPALRRMVRETELTAAHLVAPVFVAEALTAPRAIASMPGMQQWPVGRVADEARALRDAGVPAVLLFGIPAAKDAAGTASRAAGGVVQRAVAEIRAAAPELLIVTDVCLCEYTEHGHCGILAPARRGGEREIDRAATLEALGAVAVSHAEAGADVVAPSAMLDGMVGAIRTALDRAGHGDVPILSYSAKFASGFYGPFREAGEGAPTFGDRTGHQMDPANAREALLESELDVGEGADMLMVKPALAYLDIVRLTRDRFPALPLAAYNVSGEYAMVKAAAAQGWLDERTAVLEILGAMRRAGADLIITYHARDAARWLAGA